MPTAAFFIQIATRQSEAQLMAECALCGAVTYAPRAYAWQARSVACCECGTRKREVIMSGCSVVCRVERSRNVSLQTR